MQNNFVGSPCGIMDQFVITAATADHALLLNTRDLTYLHLPMIEGELADCSIVVTLRREALHRRWRSRAAPTRTRSRTERTGSAIC